ncbi:MAG: trehalose-phosphatase [Acidobacteria bacterium]|nr:trehalose-phosphatase [Acidobacteriota bacterium]
MDNLAEIGERVRGARRILLFLDFDGTLAPLSPIPSAAALPAGVWEILRALTASRRFVVTIISGRSVADLRTGIRLRRLIYAGNFGLEVRGLSLCFREPAGARAARAVARLCPELTVRLRHLRGAAVEDKGLTACVHFRRVSRAQRHEVRRIVRAAVESTSRLAVAEDTGGLEILPSASWNKGCAVNWIRNALGEPQELVIYAGDEASDEAAFAVLPDAVTVHVGRAGRTTARYWARDPAQIRDFLRWLSRPDRMPV